MLGTLPLPSVGTSNAPQASLDHFPSFPAAGPLQNHLQGRSNWEGPETPLFCLHTGFPGLAGLSTHFLTLTHLNPGGLPLCFTEA